MPAATNQRLGLSLSTHRIRNTALHLRPVNVLQFIIYLWWTRRYNRKNILPKIIFYYGQDYTTGDTYH